MEKQTKNESMKLPDLTYRDGVGLVDSSGMPTRMQSQQKPESTSVLNPDSGSESKRDRSWPLTRMWMLMVCCDLLETTLSWSGTGDLPDADAQVLHQQIESLIQALGRIGAPTAGPSESNSTPTSSDEKPCEKPVLNLPRRNASGNRYIWERNENKWTIWRYYQRPGGSGTPIVPAKFVAYSPTSPTSPDTIQYFQTFEQAVDYVWRESSANWLAQMFAEYFERLAAPNKVPWESAYNKHRLALWMRWFLRVQDLDDVMDRIEGL